MQTAAFTSGSPNGSRRSRPGSSDPMPTAMPIAQCLAELAAAWNETQSHAISSDESGVLSPASLEATADALSITISDRQARIRDARSADFPCIVLLKSGLGRIVLSRRNDDLMVRGADGTDAAVPLAAVEAEEAGTLFFPRRREFSASGLAQETAAAATGLLHDLFDEMIAKRLGLVVQLLVVAALGNMLLLSLPLFSMAVYDRVVPHTAFETLWALAIGVGLALVIDFALRYVRIKLQDAMALSGSEWLQARVFRHLLAIRLADRPQSSSTFTAQVRDVEGFCQCIPLMLTGLVVDLPFILLSLALLAHLGGPVALVPAFGIALIVAVNTACHAVSQSDVRQTVFNTRMQADMLNDAFSELEAVKAAGREACLTERWERLQDQMVRSGHASRLASGLAAYASSFLGQAVLVVTMVTAVYEISSGAMTMGAMSASTMLVGRMLGPMGQLAGVWHRLTSIHDALGSLEDFLKKPLEAVTAEPQHIAKVHGPGDIALRDVSFAYPGGTGRLSGITLDIKAGERVGLIGRSGSGKSTLMRLITRLQDPIEGTVLFEGRNVTQYRPSDLRASLGYMPQQASLFDDTLLANIVVRDRMVDRDRLERAMDISGVKLFASRHPEGLGLRVGPRGERLSIGERQSVLLARILYLDPPSLLLDEPTASMDTILEAAVARALAAHTRGRTLIMATHRAALLPLVDRLVWIDNGRVVADGPKADVLSQLTRQAAA